jgi:hypothetical protein
MALGRLKNDGFFISIIMKKPGKQRVFRKKKDAKKGSGRVGGPRKISRF